MQFADRTNHQRQEETNQDRRAERCQQYQRGLHGTQQIGIDGVTALHRQHQVIDPPDKALQFPVESLQGGFTLVDRLLQKTGHQRPHGVAPSLLDGEQSMLDIAIARRGQRPRRVAMAQIAQHMIEAFEFSRDALAEGDCLVRSFETACHQVGDAVGSHALAAGIVNCRRHPGKLPGEIERHADGRQGDQEEGNQDPDDLAGHLAGECEHRELLIFSFSMFGTLAPRY